VKVGTVLPHMLKFGGVRRFLEIGNRLAARGHEHLLAVKPGEASCDWMEYRGRIVGLDDLLQSSDVLLVGDPPCITKYVWGHFPKDRLYVYVIAGGEYFSQYDKFYGRCPFLLCNRVFQTRYPKGILLEGAVNTQGFRRTRSLRVGYQAGKGKSKGEALVRDALKDIPGLQPVPIQGVVSDQVLRHVYEGLDYFVAWEQREGWSNMAAEALACGVPVVTNGRNVEPFRDRCILVEDLRGFFLNPMGDFTWDGLVTRLLEIFNGRITDRQ